MNGSKMARNSAQIVNRPNCGGTSKKSGLAPRIGWCMSSNPTLVGAQQRLNPVCTVSKTVQTQKTGYRATIGGRMG